VGITLAVKNPTTQKRCQIFSRPENANRKYKALFDGIDYGKIKLPLFQRDFVWDKEQSAKLIDSILKGYPIGAFILWETKEALKSAKNIGNHDLRETSRGEYVQYVLDGQQRITSLYAIYKGICISKDKQNVDYRDIFIDLDFDPSKDEQIVTVQKNPNKKNYISAHTLLTGKNSELLSLVGAEKINLIQDYKKRITTYNFATITIKDHPMDIACDIFARINTGGKSLTLFEVMVAMTYDEDQDFDLGLKYGELLYGNDKGSKCLKTAMFDTIPPVTVLQAVAAITAGSVRAKDILKINRKNFIRHWQPMVSSMFMAVDFIRTKLHVLVSQFLPYPALLVHFTYFFHKNRNKKATEVQAKLLTQFFYWAGVNWRYNSSTETRITQDLKKIDAILKGKNPAYLPEQLKMHHDDIANYPFSTSDSHVKTILCLLASKRPRNLDDDGQVLLDNSNLKIASSRNYHHFFPKAYVYKKFDNKKPDQIANITLIDANSNQKISAKPPKSYLKEFEKSNSNLPSD